MSETAKLTNSDAQAGDRLGYAVAIDGDTIVVGNSSTNHGGPAYVFVKSAGGWADMSQTAKLTPPLIMNQGFVGPVAILGNTIIVGSPQASAPGAAYVFERPASGWIDAAATQEQKMSDPDGVGETSFGASIGMDGSTVVITASWPTYKAFVFPTLLNQQPVAIARFLDRVVVGESVEFDGTDSHDPGGTVETYAWDFGDGEDAEGGLVHHVYVAAGRYFLSLRVTDNEGASVSTPALSITVVSIPVAIQDLMDEVRGQSHAT